MTERTQNASDLEDLLMRSAVAGDRDALDRLYSLTATPLYAYLRRLGNSAADADDLLQTTFLNAWRSRTRFNGDGARPWLFTIARNAFLSMRSKQSRDDTCAQLPTNEGSPAQHYEATALSRCIDAALETLPHDTREALVLSRFSGMSIADIAALLGTSEGNVRVRIHRGLSRLREAAERVQEKRG